MEMKKDLLADMNSKTRGHYSEKELAHWKKLKELFQEYDLQPEAILQYFGAFVRRRDMPKFLANYELFKLVVGLPGSIAEVGVFLGNSFFTWSKLLETFCPGDRSRKVYGFEGFFGYSKPSEAEKSAVNYIKNFVGEMKVSQELLEGLVKLHNDDNLIPGVDRCILVPGDVTESVPKFLNESTGLRFCLINIDVNLYTPTKVALQLFYDRLVPGGVVAINGYGNLPWEGESKALDEFLAELNPRPNLQRFPFSPNPGAYFIKV
jgi:hypothetical protein